MRSWLIGVLGAHYNNAAANKNNPDPNKTVYFGDMTWEEMMVPFADS